MKIILSVIGALLLSHATKAQKQKPNVLFIFFDDMGWSDLGCYGNDYHLTPHIDEIANSGVRFSNSYAASPVCSPTRASIMTGKDPAHSAVNITNWLGSGSGSEWRRKTKLIPPVFNKNLPKDQVTLGEAFKSNGYKTFYCGKWHLGETEEYWPHNMGFDINKGGWMKGNPGHYFAPYNNPMLEDGPDGEYLPTRLAEETMKFMEDHQKTAPDQPFFIFHSLYLVHTPIEALEPLKEKFRERRKELGIPEDPGLEPEGTYRNRTIHNHPEYAAMMYAADSVVGMLNRKLVDLGIDENTIIVLFSDNGGLSVHRNGGPTTNVPLRAGKGWLYEGGIREPLIIKWPSKTDLMAGSTLEEPVISHDLYPSLLDMAGLPLLPGQHANGKSFAPLLHGEAFERGPLFWHYPTYSPVGNTPSSAIREGDWKLIYFFETDECELYNLAMDLSEKNDLAATEPERVDAMKKKLFDHLDKIGAKFPEVSPSSLPYIKYSFDSGGSDAMGNSDCILMENASIVNDKIRGNVLKLNPVSGHAVLDPAVFSDVHNYTVSCWFKNLDPTTQRQAIFELIRSDSRYIILSPQWRNHYQVHVMNGAGTHASAYDPDGAVPLEEWHQLVLCQRNGLLGLYLDGAMVDAVANEVSPASIGADTAVIGFNYHRGVNVGIKALVDDFAFYKRGLNSVEVKDLYNAQRTRIGK